MYISLSSDRGTASLTKRTAVARNALEVALRKGKGNLLALQHTETVHLSSNGFAEDQGPLGEVLGFSDFSTQ